MGSIAKIARKLRAKRLVTQAAFLAVLNLNLFLAKDFLALRGICLPGFYCHSCPWAIMACPLGVLVNFSALAIVPLLAIGVLGLVGTLGGRLVCGWFCPFGFFQDLLHKIPGRKFTLPRQLNYVKYGLLVGTIFALPYFMHSPTWSFCYVCPSATLESTIPWAFKGLFAGFTAKFYAKVIILAGVMVLAVLVSRGFCRVFCPLGAIFSLFNRMSLFRFQLKHKKCTSCGVCSKICPVDIDPVSQMNTEECIRCLDCTTTKHIGLGVR